MGSRIETALQWTKKTYLPPRPSKEVTTDSLTGDIIAAFRDTANWESAASSLALNFPQFN